jgi:serine/threonine protein phosphatase PrpC
VAPSAPCGATALLVVADGMGGHAAGEVASRMAVDGLLDSLSRASRGPYDLGVLLEAAVKQVNSAVYDAGTNPEHRGMGTTLTAALVVNSDLYVANVGDSRCYLLRNGHLKQITEDHSYVGEQVRSGALTAEQARTHPQRNVITRAIGLEPTVEVDIFTEPIRADDRILLCSDGLYPLVPESELIEVLTDNKPDQACEDLVDRANANGGHDNVTVAIGIVEKKRTSQRRRQGKVKNDRHTTHTKRQRTTTIKRSGQVDGRLHRLLRQLKNRLGSVFVRR